MRAGRRVRRLLDGRAIERLSVPDGTDFSQAFCVSASDGSVYIGGMYAGADENYTEFPCCWKDGALEPLETPEGADFGSVDAIAVKNGKVYAAGGYLHESADHECYWVDGKQME